MSRCMCRLLMPSAVVKNVNPAHNNSYILNIYWTISCDRKTHGYAMYRLK